MLRRHHQSSNDVVADLPGYRIGGPSML